MATDAYSGDFLQGYAGIVRFNLCYHIGNFTCR